MRASACVAEDDDMKTIKTKGERHENKRVTKNIYVNGEKMT